MRPIAFVIDLAADPISLRGVPATVPFASAASTRLRAVIPALALARERDVHLVPPRHFLADPTLAAFGDLEAIVVGKLVRTGEMVRRPDLVEGVLDRVRKAAARRPVLADLCDHLVAQGEAEKSDLPRRFVAGLGTLAWLTVPTGALADAIAPYGCRGISVVEDPYEGPSGAPRGPAAHGPVRLAWFGLITADSARPLAATLEALARRPPGRPLAVEIVANASAAQGVAGLARSLAPRLAVTMTVWTPDAVARALAAADLVLLPQDTQAAWTRVKSHNRLVETIRAGRLALASPIPAYRELADFAWVGDDIAAGLDWALARPDEALGRIVAGQAAIEARFSPSAVGRRWTEAIVTACDAARAG